MRLFIAVDLDQQTRDDISRILDEFGNVQGKIKLVKPENMHLTLKFIGKADENTAQKICAILSDTSKKFSSFKMELSGFGCFPDIKNPSVLWIGIKEGKEQLTSLAHCLNDGLCKLGFEKEKRPFSAHITLARIDFLKDNRIFQEKMENLKFCGKKLINICEIILFESILTPAGPIYKKLQAFPLG